MKYRITRKWTSLILAFVMISSVWAWHVQHADAAGDAALSLKVEVTDDVKAGDEIRIHVYITANELYSGTVNLSFPTLMLEPVDAQTSSRDSNVLQGLWEGHVIRNKVDRDSGLVEFSWTQLGEHPGLNMKDTLLYTATFKALTDSVDPAQVKFAEVTLVNPNIEVMDYTVIAAPEDDGQNPQPPQNGGNPVLSPYLPNSGDSSDVEGRAEYSSAQLQEMLKEGPLNLVLPRGAGTLILPVETAALLNGQQITVTTSSDVSLLLPHDIFVSLAELAGQAPDARIILTVQELSAAEISQLAMKASALHQAEIVSAGTALELYLSVELPDGTPHSLTSFPTPVRIEMDVTGDANPDLTGLYLIAEDGSLSYMDGRVKQGRMSAELPHFSTYGVFEYMKTFGDVPATHWAYDTIQRASTLQITSGIDASTFAPSREVTRAEFTALITRALGLEVSGAGRFSDVQPTAWYASDIHAAAEAGIIAGVGDGTFAPNAPISRQEMAVMAVRALMHVQPMSTPIGTAESVQPAFTDLDSSASWAKSYIQQAAQYELMRGQGNGRFMPQGLTTRAESVQVILNIWERMKSE